MKIEDSRIGKMVPFRDLSFGDCFVYNGEYYIKLDAVNAFDLEHNSVNAFYERDNKVVTPINAKVVIE